ncbi:MAG: PASTA domain-containing protein [Clostridia bacterium]|nr:PASTA domain-containing protein [Clostridia bacterium]MBR0089360.1 PASTA domain-containing protein [Clostridia bacterium]
MKPSLNEIKRKSWILAVSALIALSALVLRVGYWQIIRGEELSGKAKAQQQGSSIITASRGTIYDRNGKVLAESASANTLICNPEDIKDDGDADVIAQKLAPILDMDSTKIKQLITKETRYQVIKKRMSKEQTDKVRELMNSENDAKTAKAMSGVYFEEDSKRYYPFNVAPHVLGFTGYDNNGIQGIELTFDNELMGRNGSVDINQNADGTTLQEQQAEYVNGALKGYDVVLTIDETLQHFLEKHLEEAVAEDKLKEGAAGIIMNPKTGEILAMATKPDFDVNDPYNIEQFRKYAVMFESMQTTADADEDEDEDEEKKPTPKPTMDPNNLSDEYIASMRNKMWRNKAISDTYEPGSTFKIITAAAALEEHVVDLNSSFYCPGFKIVADRNIKCANTDGHGPETFVEGVKNSCNPVFMELGLRLGSDKFMEYFRAFGLTETTGMGLVGEASSIYYHKTMGDVDIATSSFGQGFQITPVQLATAVSAVVNGGVRMQPRIVKEIRNSNGVVKSYETQQVQRVISEETSQTMRDILESVVADPTATGKNAYVKGCRIGGKTGTSEKGNRLEEKRIASFVGFAPANDPELVCLVMLDEPQVDNKYGGTIAAPLVGEIIEDSMNYLGIEKQYSSMEKPDEKIEIPDVRQLEEDEAREVLSNAGLNVNAVGDGTIIVDQLPKPGIMISKGSTVVIYSEERSDSDMVTVPNLEGCSVDDAEYTLAISGLNFEVIGAGHSEVKGSYAVRQSVAAGEKVAPATVIGVEFRQLTTD